MNKKAVMQYLTVFLQLFESLDKMTADALTYFCRKFFANNNKNAHVINIAAKEKEKIMTGERQAFIYEIISPESKTMNASLI